MINLIPLKKGSNNTFSLISVHWYYIFYKKLNQIEDVISFSLFSDLQSVTNIMISK